VRVRGDWEFDGQSIPGSWFHDPQSEDGLRFVASKFGYRKLRMAKCHAAYERCTIQGPQCVVKAPLHKGELHHTGKHGRGAGGAYRDDRFTDWTCRPCHDWKEKQRTGSRWNETRSGDNAVG